MWVQHASQRVCELLSQVLMLRPGWAFGQGHECCAQVNVAQPPLILLQQPLQIHHAVDLPHPLAEPGCPPTYERGRQGVTLGLLGQLLPPG